MKDFRYKTEIQTEGANWWVEISICVALSGRGNKILDGDLTAMCAESGCRDTAVDRLPHIASPRRRRR
jgi:hypothetical protein